LFKRVDGETAAVAADLNAKLSIQQAHARLGHMSETATRQAAKALGWTLTPGSMTPCEMCAIGKGRQKNLPKDSGGPVASLLESGVYLDCCTFKDKTTRKASHVWRLMVFYPSQLKISDIYKKKSDMFEPTLEKLSQLIQQKIGPKYLRMDNAGENVDLAARIKHKDWKLPIKVEWTARDTPQQNSPAEVGISTLGGRARSMLQDANVPEALRTVLMVAAVKTATLLDSLIPIEIDGTVKTRYEHQFGSLTPFAQALRTFGEAGTVTIKSRTHQPKEKGRGLNCMMVGYCPDHGVGTYRMFDPNTNGLHLSRDVTWLRRKFYPSLLAAGEGEIITPTTETPAPTVEISETDPDEAEVEETSETNPEDEDEDEDHVEDDVEDNGATDGVDDAIGANANTLPTTRSGRIIKLPSYLRDNYETSHVPVDYNIALTLAEVRYYQAMSEFGFSCVDHDGVEMAMVGAGVGGGFINTNELRTLTFDQLMASPDKNEWLKAVHEEYENMKENGVFEVTQTCDIPKGAKVLSTTWVLKKKANGRRKGRITARGFEQRDGEHFDSADKASPVVHDITIRIVLTLIVMGGLWAEIVDVKGAFLTADFEPHHKMYITVPKGFEEYYPGNVV
jgi:hypothetical protein